MNQECDKKRVVFVLPTADTSRIGGMEMVAANLLHSLDSAQYDLSLICLGSNNGVIPRIDQTRVSLQIIEKRPGIDLSLLVRLVQFLRRSQPDLIHTFNSGALIYTFPAAKLARVPAIVHAEHGRFADSERPMYARVRVLMTRAVDHVIPVSKEIEQALIVEEGVDHDKVTLVNNGVDTEPFDAEMDRAAYRRELGLTPDDWAVGNVGSLTLPKNQKLLVQAASKQAGFKVLIAGAGPKEEELRSQIADLGLSKRVFLVGERSDIPQFLRAMDVFCLPSVTEGTSLALLEAMAASLPIVATDVGSNSELVVNGKAGFVVPSEDLEGLVSHLEWTTHHREECKKMGALGKAFVADKYSFAHTTKAYDTIFKMVLQGKTKQK